MSTSVYITNNPLHVLFSISLINKKVFNDEHLIIWCGTLCLDNYFPKDSSIFDNNILDLSSMNLNHFIPLQKNYKKFINKVELYVKEIDYLITCFDTSLCFEAIRHRYSVKWNRVVILEDGIGNYFRSTMPVLKRQVPKSILNFLVNGYFLNITRSNLGGNPKIGFISCLVPELVYKHKKSKAKILSVKKEFTATLENSRVKIPKIYKDADVLISITPIFSQKRMSKEDFIDYIYKILNHSEIRHKKNILIKPHPREDLEILKKVLNDEFGDRINIGDQGPIELYLPDLQNMIWTGLPSSGFLNSFLLYGPVNKFIVFPLYHMPFSSHVLKALKKLMGSALEIYDVK